MNQFKAKDVSQNRVGEVVASVTYGFTSECYTLYDPPPLGAIVRTGSSAIYAVVYSISTEALDPGRRVLARGHEETVEENVYKQNPQLGKLLCTRFESLIVGHQEQGDPVHRLSPIPPKVHAFVYRCESEEIVEFTKSLDFLQILLNASIGNLDDVIVATVHNAMSAHSSSDDFILQCGRYIARYLAHDAGRLNGILKKLSV
jgi:hypothetical protein